jgi:hypothetical protein
MTPTEYWGSYIGLRKEHMVSRAPVKTGEGSRKRKQSGASEFEYDMSAFSKAILEDKAADGAFDWGLRSRDRVISCMLAFGFGRWPRIISESGLRGLSSENVENFGKSYILQCGIAADGKADRADSNFVKVR